MKNLISISLILLAATPAFAKKSCDELKTEIEEKLKSKGVVSYSLEVVNNADVKDQKVVGSCNGSTQKIVYLRK